MAGPWTRSDDVTAKARIRRAALHLVAEHGVGATSRRTVAASDGVTVGLVVHHYGTKEALCEAVELEVVDLFAEAIASVPGHDRAAAELVAARDVAVAEMLAGNPAVADDLRRAILDGGDRKDLVSRLTELTAQQVPDLRTAVLASTRQTVGDRVVTVMVRQLGRLFLRPLVGRIAEEFDDLAGPSRPSCIRSNAPFTAAGGLLIDAALSARGGLEPLGQFRVGRWLRRPSGSIHSQLGRMKLAGCAAPPTRPRGSGGPRSPTVVAAGPHAMPCRRCWMVGFT